MNAEAFWQDVGEGIVSCNDRAAVCFQDVADHRCVVDIEDFERDVLGVRQSVAVSDRELVGHSTELVVQRSDGDSIYIEGRIRTCSIPSRACILSSEYCLF